MLIAAVIFAFLLAGLFGLLWLLSGSESGTASRVYEPEILNENDSMNVSIPNEWEPHVIEQRITSLVNSDNIALVDHIVESVKKRIIMRQDDRTAKTSTEFMTSLIERLGVVKQLRTAYDDLKLYEKELDVRVTKLDIEQLEQDLKLGDLKHQKETQAKINELKQQEKEREHQLRMAQLERDIDNIKNPPKAPPPPPPPPPPPTREEIRKKKWAEHQERLSKLRRDRAADLARRRARGESEDQLRRAENFWEDAEAREEEEGEKWV